jgi:hypothetical protein
MGSSPTIGQPDNGIDFSNIQVELIAAVPEPSSAALLLAGMLMLSRAARRKT